MKVSALLTYLVLISASVVSQAAELATSQDNQQVRSEAASDIQSLFGIGRIPRIGHLDQKYKSRSSKQCRSAWRTLRRKNVRQRPIASPATILAKAKRAGISERHIKRTLGVYLANRDSIPNQRYITIIDFNKDSRKKRMYTIDLANGNVKSYHTAAGQSSDPNGDGTATHFSNRSGSNASSLGCSLAAGEYNGKNGRSLMLHGFESTNDNSCDRAIVVHGAKYVGGVPGRSWGCPAVKHGDVREVFNKITGGGLVCAYKDGNVHEAKASKSSKKKLKKKHKKKLKKQRRKKNGRR